jgi:hypothetical protein
MRRVGWFCFARVDAHASAWKPDLGQRDLHVRRGWWGALRRGQKGRRGVGGRFAVVQAVSSSRRAAVGGRWSAGRSRCVACGVSGVGGVMAGGEGSCGLQGTRSAEAHGGGDVSTRQ